MDAFHSTVTLERVKELLNYDPETGLFTWLERRGRCRTGDVAGWLEKNGYRRIIVVGKKFKSHRLAWAMFYGTFPELEIDHINGVRDDNRIANLRLATRSQNAQNLKRALSNSSHGFLGVKKNGNRWNASINIDGQYIYLGCFKTPEKAHQEYIEAKRCLHEFCTI